MCYAFNNIVYLCKYYIQCWRGTTGSALALLMKSLDMDRIKAKCEQLDDFCDKSKLECSMIRLVPRTSDSFDAFEWVPGSLKDKQCLPENTSSFGSPWILRNAASAPRFGSKVWPCPGLGAFVAQITGPALYMMWPVAWTASINVSMDDAWTYTSSMQPKEFDAFWSQAVYHCALHPDEVLWLPYGWSAVMVSLEQDADDSSKALLVPFANTKLLARTSQQAIRCMASCVENVLKTSTPTDPISKYAPAYKEWLRAAVQEQASGDPKSDDECGLASASQAGTAHQGGVPVRRGKRSAPSGILTAFKKSRTADAETLAPGSQGSGSVGSGDVAAAAQAPTAPTPSDLS